MEQDFRFASFTAVISDLHLCEAEPVHPKFPLWKKYKTRQFFFDEAFRDFLRHLRERAGHEPVELVLNGDIFDFDSVLSLPDEPPFRVSYLEKHRGLDPHPERSAFKVKRILQDHVVFFAALREFIQDGNRVVFTIGNHDLELHYEIVRDEVLRVLDLSPEGQQRLRFVEWFYISNKDTLIEHGNQYDPYCVCEDPVNPFSQGYNYKTMRLPFGNLACRYLTNGMGFFNPHVDSNYIMTVPQYVKFFLKYMVRAQPLIMLTWFFGALITLWKSVTNRFDSVVKDPLKIEDRVNEIAKRSNADPRMVREMRELFVTSANTSPWLLMRELWLDRALLILFSFFALAELMVLVRQIYDVSFFWIFIPLFLLLPFFLFYSKSVVSNVSGYKEPDERTLARTVAVTNCQRVIYGHTHIVRHEMIGAVEHLNSGTWSPAFLDVECTRAIDQKNFVWIEPVGPGKRQARLLSFREGTAREVVNPAPRRTK